MGKKIIFEGKTPEDAVEKAIAETGVPVSELKFEILSHGGSGIFGLGLKKAKIEVTLPDLKTEAVPKPKRTPDKPKKEQPKNEPAKPESSEAEPKDAPEETRTKAEERPRKPAEKAPTQKTEAPRKEEAIAPVTTEETTKELEPGQQFPTASNINLDAIFNNSKGVKDTTSDGGWAQPSRQTKLPKKKIKVRSYAELRGDHIMPDKVDIDLTDGEMERREKQKAERGTRTKERREPKRRDFERERPARRPPEPPEEDEFKIEFVDDVDDFDGEEREEPKPGRDIDIKVEIGETPITTEAPEGAIQEHLEIGRKIVTEFLEKSFPDFELESGWREDKLYYNILGDGSGLLIGRKGQTLDALQFLVNKMIDRKIGSHVRVMVDTEGYRGRREVSLQKQAEELGNRAIRSGKATITMPLNPHDRRIIHLALKESEVLKTRSRGNGTYKKVVISPK